MLSTFFQLLETQITKNLNKIKKYDLKKGVFLAYVTLRVPMDFLKNAVWPA